MASLFLSPAVYGGGDGSASGSGDGDSAEPAIVPLLGLLTAVFAWGTFAMPMKMAAVVKADCPGRGGLGP